MGQPTMAPIKRHTRYLRICVKGENRPPGHLLNTFNPTPLLHVCTCAGTRARPGLNVDPRHLSVLGAADECSTPANTRTCAHTRTNPSAPIVACILSIDPDTKRSLPCGRLTTKMKPTIQKTKRKMKCSWVRLQGRTRHMQTAASSTGSPATFKHTYLTRVSHRSTSVAPGGERAIALRCCEPP
jgi:hypothetical protein